MLQSIRERAQGVIAWFIVVLITIPFALWGIQEYLGVSSEQVVASVNGNEISVREFDSQYRQFRQNLRQRLGKNYRPELMDEKVLRKQVLDSMIRDELIMQSADSLSLRAGNDLVRQTILTIPSFQVGGVFNQDAYERALQSQGLSQAAFEERVRRAIVSEQLSRAISSSEFTTDSEINDIVRLRQQQREIKYLTIPSSKVADQVLVAEEEIKSTYDTNPSDYMDPEKVKVEFIELDIEQISKTLKGDEEHLLGYYEQHKSEYVRPEQRKASHILFAVEDFSDEAVVSKAETAAREALKQLREGADFAEMAKKLSQDPGSAEQGGDLGFFEKGVMDPEFDKAVFSLSKGEISELVKTAFGFHIIKLTAIDAEAGKPFQEIRGDIEKAYLKEEAQKKFYDYAERLSNAAYEDPNSLQPAADAVGMKVKTSDWVTRDSKEGIFASPKVQGALFSEEVLSEGLNSESIELEPEHMVVLRVTEHQEANVKSYDLVYAEIKEKLAKQKAAELTKTKGEEILQRLRKGEITLADAAKEEGLSVEEKGKISHDTSDLPSPILQNAYRIKRPAEGEITFGTAELDDGGFTIIALSEVTDGTADQVDKLGGKDTLKRALQRAKGDVYFNQLVESLRNRASIQLTQEEQ